MHPLHEQFAPARRTLATQLGAPAARFLLERMSARELPPGAVLLEQGAACDALYFVLGGRLDVHVDGATDRVRVGEIGDGEWVGEVTFVDPRPASAWVTARETTLVVELRNRDIEHLTDDRPDVVAALLDRLSLVVADRLLAVGAAPEPPEDDTRRRWWWPFGGNS